MFSPISVFGDIYTAMRKTIKTLLLAWVLVLVAVPDVHSQESRPGSANENLIISAVTKYNDKDFEGAKAILTAVLAEDAENDAAWYYLAMTSLEERNAAEAEEFLKKAVELDPQNFWYRYKLARLYAVTSRQEVTVDMYEKLLEDFPKKSDLYFDLVELYSAQGEYEKSLETMKEVETVFGMTEAIAMYRFNLLRRMGRHEEAYESLEVYNKEFS